MEDDEDRSANAKGAENGLERLIMPLDLAAVSSSNGDCTKDESGFRQVSVCIFFSGAKYSTTLKLGGTTVPI